MITIDELLNMMSVFIEIGEGKGHKVIFLVSKRGNTESVPKL